MSNPSSPHTAQGADDTLAVSPSPLVMPASSSHSRSDSIDVDSLSPLPPARINTSIDVLGPPTSSLPTWSLEGTSADELSPAEEKLPQPVSLSGQATNDSTHAKRAHFALPNEAPASSSSHAAAQPQYARYVTVSAILSRSGAYIVSQDGDGGHDGESLDSSDEASHSEGDASRDESDVEARSKAAEDLVTSLTRRRRRNRTSADVRRGNANGSALEALGALLLKRDSAGRASNLSSTRYARRAGARGNDAADEQGKAASRRTDLFSRVSQAWLRSVREAAGAATLRMPGEEHGSTIAERRARKNGAALDEAPIRVGTKRNQPSFVLERPPAPKTTTSPKSSKIRPLRRTQSEAPRFGPQIYDEDISPLLEPVDPNIITSRSRPPRSQGYGPGSAFGIQGPPEAPPSPVGMPGAWSGGHGWRAKPGDGHEEGALLLPPPLLDQGSDAQSFEGLLGVRRMREREKALKEYQRLAARNRPLKKKGMLTALSNFVQAAHAADRAIKAANRASADGSIISRSGFRARPAFMSRRHSEPGFSKVEATEQEDKGGGNAAAVPVESTHQPPRARMAPRSSLESAGRPLHTVLEASPALDTGEGFAPAGEDGEQQTHSKDSSLSSLESSTSSTSYGHDRPRAPHLLPVNLSVPPSPFTPIVGRTPLQGPVTDYMHARPRSPWTPKLGATMSGSYRLHLNMAAPHGSGASGIATPLVPGTPRLAPVSIDMIPSPSPFPSPAPSIPSSSPRMRALMSNGAAASSSPIMNPLDGVVDAFTRGAASPTSLPALAEATSTPTAPPSSSSPPSTAPTSFLRQRRKGSSDLTATAVTSRMTPSSMLAGGHIATALSPVSPLPPVSPHPRPVLSRPGSARRRSSSMRRSSSAQSTQGAEALAASAQATTQRSFLLWFLFGDLGLRRRDSSASESTASSYGGLALFLVHLWGFLIFLLAHLIDLGYRVAETTGVTLWFVKWLFLNLTGRTVLSRCIVDAYGLIRAEWETVAKEDHEDRGRRRRRASLDAAAFGGAEEDEEDDELEPKGLTKWEVARGLIELACLQAVTKERYLREGAGLELFRGWRKKGTRRRSAHPRESYAALNGQDKAAKGPIDIGSQRQRQREAFKLEQTRRAQDEEDEVTDASEDEGQDSSSDGESSDDDLVVTRQGADVLEFSKTPRLEPRRTGRTSSIGSVGSSVGGGMGHGHYFAGGVPGSEALPGTALSPRSPSLYSIDGGSPARPGSHAESPRSLVKTIKWASRLAISAYGLHVTLVDLPPTFTPSGERFSRQTFAHLSRLKSDDVLHADIQALDSDAYSPTFYLVRDFKRRIVVVSVRGTQSLQDIIVDLEMSTAKIDLPPTDVSAASGELTCHAGILRAAKALLERESSLFKILSQAMEENQGFGVVFTGHSLGAAIACTSVLLLSEYRKPEDATRDPKEGYWVTRSDVGLPAGRPIRAIGFAHPASVSAALAERASLGATPLVVSVVLGSDIIPRCGHGQAREVRRVLGALSRVRRRAEKGKKRKHTANGGGEGREEEEEEEEEEEDARVHIVRSWWDWRSLRRQGQVEGETLMRGMRSKADRIEEQLWRLRRDVEADLYAAVRRRTDLAPRGGAGSDGAHDDVGGRLQSVPPSPWVGPKGRETAPLHQLAARRQALDAATLRSEEAQGGVLVPPGKSYWIPSEGDDIFVVTSPLSFFSLPDLDPSLFSAHLPSAYEAKLSEDIK